MTKIIPITSKQLFNRNTFKYLTFLSMIYLSCELASLVLSYKIVSYAYFFGSAASFIFPITYTWNDIITEVYGFKIAVRTIWYVFFCDYIFVFLVLLVIQAPSENSSFQESYILVLGSLWRSLSAEMAGVLIGAFINSALISKCKILTKGKWFWARTIISSAIGELIMLIISVPIALYGIISNKELITLIVFAYSYKIIFAIIISGPANFIANILKTKEGIDVYDFDVNYNPFKLANY